MTSKNLFNTKVSEKKEGGRMEGGLLDGKHCKKANVLIFQSLQAKCCKLSNRIKLN
jgi:hypothetical protein